MPPRRPRVGGRRRPLKPRKKIGIVLGGGGSKGSFEVGALHYYYSKYNKFKPFAVVGTSVGSMNGIKIAEGEGTVPYSGHTHYMGYEGLQKLWIELNNEHDMVKEEKAFKKLFGPITEIEGSLFETNAFDKYISLAKMFVLSQYGGKAVMGLKVIEKLLKYKDIVKFLGGGAGLASVATGFGTLALLVTAVSALLSFLSFSKLKDLAENLTDLIQSQGLFSLSPVEDTMRGNFSGRIIPHRAGIDMNKLRTSGIKFFATIVGMNTGKLRYVDKFGNMFERDNLRNPIQRNVDIVDAVIASGSQPVIHVPKEIAGEVYVDGGVMEILPIQAAFDIGCDRVIAIIPSTSIQELTQGEKIRLKEEMVTLLDGTRSKAKKSYLHEIFLRTIDVFLEEIKEGDINPINGWKKPVTIIRPEITVHDGMTIDPGLIRINMNYGHMRTFEIENNINPDSNGDFVSTKLASLRQQAWISEEKLFEKIVNLRITSDDLKKYVKPHLRERGPLIRELDLNDFINDIRTQKDIVKTEVENRIQIEGMESIMYFPAFGEPTSWYGGWEDHSLTPPVNSPSDGLDIGPFYVNYSRTRPSGKITNVKIYRRKPRGPYKFMMRIKYNATN